MTEFSAKDREGDRNPFRRWIEGEEWRKIDGFPLYEISSLGRVRSWQTGKPRNRCLALSHYGYLFVALPDQGVMRTFYINRLVCGAWHGPAPTPEHQAAHLDGDPLNNSPDNLIWATPSENNLHKRWHGTSVSPGQCGSANAQAKLTEKQIPEIYSALASGTPVTHIAARYGVGETTIRRIRDGECWKHVSKEPA